MLGLTKKDWVMVGISLAVVVVGGIITAALMNRAEPVKKLTEPKA